MLPCLRTAKSDWLERKKMISYSQGELSSIWQKLRGGTEHDVYDEIDVAELVSSQNLVLLMARTVTNLDVEQTLAISASVGAVESYRDKDKDCDSTIGSYSRISLNKEAPWGAWQHSEDKR
jgi:hypothetical protein